MKRQWISAVAAVVGGAGCLLLMGAAASTENSAPPSATRTTFYRDVLPILQNSCQTCHRPGEIGPMSLLTYRETQPWAIAIKMVVMSRLMPPWYADPQYGHFANQRSLSPQEIRTLVTWVDGGAQPGNPKDGPPPKKFVDGWQIGLPDRIIEMPIAFTVPAEGTIPYQYMVIPGGFTHDTWVRAAEARPGNRAVLHHMVAFIRPPDSNWLRGINPGEFVVPGTPAAHRMPMSEHTPAEKKPEGEPAHPRVLTRRADLGELLVTYTPGMQPLELTNEAKLIKAGSDIVLQLHYTANGVPGSDRTKIGLVYAKGPTKLVNVQLGAANPSFRIPPGADNYEVKAQIQLQDDVLLSGFWPHMHFRGKDFLYQAIYPDGRTETLFSVPHYDYNWQLEYRLAQPLALPKGTRIECTAHYDNSINNPYNPDAAKEVRWGDQNWDEMMMGFFSVSIDPKVDAAALMKVEKPGTRTPVAGNDAKPSEAAAASRPGLSP